MRADERIQRGGAGLAVGDIERHEVPILPLSADVGQRCLAPLAVVPVMDDDAKAIGRKPPGNCAPDALARPRHQNCSRHDCRDCWCARSN